MYIVTLNEPVVIEQPTLPKGFKQDSTTVLKFPFCDSTFGHLGVLRFFKSECDRNPIAIIPMSNVRAVIYVEDDTSSES